MTAAAVTPDGILRELADLWVSLGQEHDGGSNGVLRACSMTLVVLSEDSDDFAALGETIAALMPEHPARAIVVRLQGGDVPSVAARVFSQCWMPFGQRRQICCEQVELTVSDASLHDLPVFVMPLCVPDLPAVVWCRSSRLVPMPQFPGAAGMASRVIVDGAALPDAKAALDQFRTQVAGGLRLGDLAWTRLTRWRESIARLFENHEYQQLIPRIQHIEVHYGGAPEPLGAWYMAAWLKSSLTASLALVPDPDAVPGEINRVVLQASGGFRVVLQARAGTLSLQANGIAQCTALPPATEYRLMREELGIVLHDPVFESTLSAAAALALSS